MQKNTIWPWFAHCIDMNPQREIREDKPITEVIMHSTTKRRNTSSGRNSTQLKLPLTSETTGRIRYLTYTMTAPPAATFLDNPRFHQTFSLPADAPRGRANPFTVKYADYGYRNETQPEQERILLFFSPLMASRLLLVTKDHLAIKHKIRIICTDRPGVGGTDPAEAKDRLNLWREAIPALLSHLSIPYVHAIVAHSGGTVYALDLLLHRPDLLLPQSDQPHQSPTYLALGAHGVDAARFGKGVVPARGQQEGGDAEQEEEGRAWEVKWEEGVWSGVMRRVYDEGVKGISEEASMLLRKGKSMKGGLGDWDDYDELVQRLREALAAAGRRLRVRVFYAEKDSVTGDGWSASKGAKWFDGCWEGAEDVVDYQSRTVQGADHDTIWGLRWGAIIRGV
ncbi:hypothetical protein N657DRAFT_671751 [Parathielavia appendiculata]|uniref:AB hydrolase-1 domain-containing protein n=1 Tax=Parathielavia appendiculata TaxID=2587402 RepID=A0AAN6TZL8_9PEZI|nr:hypothetical protein N657DRAFT_671751 [Parathielavia appendiculata]